ncbi:MAG: hypothetical protein WC867_01890 [Candidatus Pacearchaeota archaeon]|jgi:hypothetical protein
MKKLEKYYKDYKNKLEELGISGLACDIDNTITNTSVHFASELIKKFGNPENLNPEEIIKKYKIVENVPYWQEDKTKIWIQNFIKSPEEVSRIPLIDGVKYYLHGLNSLVPIGGYITARPKNLEKVTRELIINEEMPNKGIGVIMRPSNEELMDMGIDSVDEWKPLLLDYLYPQIIGIVDDEIKHAQAVKVNYPGRYYLLGYEKAPKCLISVVTCPAWKDVLREVGRYN